MVLLEGRVSLSKAKAVGIYIPADSTVFGVIAALLVDCSGVGDGEGNGMALGWDTDVGGDKVGYEEGCRGSCCHEGRKESHSFDGEHLV